MTDQTLTFRVTAEASQAQAELAKASLALKGLGASASAAMAESAVGIKATLVALRGGIDETASSFSAWLSGGIVVGGLAELTHVIADTIHGMAEMGRQADRVGVSAENFQAWTFGMREAGVAEGELSTGLDRFTRNIGEASLGTTKFGTMLQENGIDLKDASGHLRDTTSLLKDFADLIEATPDKAQRMALVTEAFGRGSAALSEALSHGGKGLDEMIVKGHELGVVMDNEMIAKAKEMDIAFDTVTTQVGTFLKEALLGDLEIIKDMVNTAKGIGNMGVTTPLTPAQDDLAKVIDQANAAKGLITGEINALNLNGNTQEANLLKDLGSYITDQTAALQAGKITMAQFKDEMDLVIKSAVGLFDELQSLDGFDFHLTIGGLKVFGTEIDTVAGKAAALLNIRPLTDSAFPSPTPNPTGMAAYSNTLQAYVQAHVSDLPVTSGGGVKTIIPGGGGAASAASDTVAGLGSQAQKAMADLSLAIAVINEKVHDGLLSTADATTAISSAKDKTNNDLATIIAKVSLLGPAGQAAADQLRGSLLTATDAVKGPIDDIAKTMSEGFASPFGDFIKGALPAAQAAKQFGDSLIQMMIDVAAKQAETKVLEPLFAKLLGDSPALAQAFGVATQTVAAAQIPVPSLKVAQIENPMMAIMANASPQMLKGAAGGNHTVNIQPPAGHEAVVTDHTSGMNTTTDVIFQAVEGRLAANLRAGRGPHVAALADTFGLTRKPR